MRYLLFTGLIMLASASHSDAAIENTSAIVQDNFLTQDHSSEMEPVAGKFQMKMEKHTAEEMIEMLNRAEKIASGFDQYHTDEPIQMVLYGEEIEFFKRANYREHKALVDLAARLDAFQIIDIKVCTYWMSQRGIELTDLPPFVDGVMRGDQESARLEQAGYAYF